MTRTSEHVDQGRLEDRAGARRPPGNRRRMVAMARRQVNGETNETACEIVAPSLPVGQSTGSPTKPPGDQ